MMRDSVEGEHGNLIWSLSLRTLSKALNRFLPTRCPLLIIDQEINNLHSVSLQSLCLATL